MKEQAKLGILLSACRAITEQKIKHKLLSAVQG
jgi:hypothetical protein